MAGFFSLGSSSGASGRETATTTPQQDQNQPTNTENNNNININNPNWAANPSHPGLVLYRNEEIYQKSFEIWQQYVQVHHHPKLLHPPQDHPHPFLHHTLYLGGGGGDPMAGPSSGGGARPSSSGPRVMMRGGGGGGGGINCQDCGNQAKKDCAHMRCRTCCKSRGFDCPTHVKSTWVPAAKRRERQQQQILSLQQQQQSQQLDIGLREKRQRESRSLANVTTDTNTNNPLPSRMGASSSGLEVGQHFPAEVSSPATFRCVRVHSVDDADEQLAYQTAVNIGGHLFKGILYDQGPDTHYPPAAGEISPGGEPSGAATLHHHNLLTSAAENPGGSGAAECLDPNAIYPPPMSTFLAGTQFFPPPRS